MDSVCVSVEDYGHSKFYDLESHKLRNVNLPSRLNRWVDLLINLVKVMYSI